MSPILSEASSLGSGELFRHLEQLGDAVPVPSSPGRLQCSLNGRRRKFGTAHPIGEIDVQLAPLHPQFLRIRLATQGFFSCFSTGVASKEQDEKFAGLDSTALRERVSGDYVAHFCQGPHDDVGPKSELPLDPVPNPLSHSSDVPLTRAKNHVAALHVSLWIAQLERGAECAKCVHLDSVVAHQIHGPKHGNHGGHSKAAV
jgi:hypothetical protein